MKNRQEFNEEAKKKEKKFKEDVANEGGFTNLFHYTEFTNQGGKVKCT